MCIITGLDEGEDIGFLYHIANESGTILSIHTKAPKADPVIHSVSDRFPAAHIYERGARRPSRREGRRSAAGSLPLPDDWPEGQYPLRKDWKQESSGLPQEGV